MKKLIAPFESNERKKIIRIIFSIILIFETYIYSSNLFLHQLQRPVFIFLDFDISYYIFHFFGIPKLIADNSIVAFIFDFSLIGLTLLCIFFPLKRIFLISFYMLFFTFLITSNSYGLFHQHLFNGVVFAVFPFLFKNNLTSKFLWEFVRYIHLFIYFSAFLWKCFRGSFFEFDHFNSILEYNLSSYMINNPSSYFTNFYKLILPHSFVLFVIGLIGLFLEGIYLIGFFTKKYDLHLFFLSISLHICFWIFADAFYFPILLVNLTLLNFNTKKSEND